MPGVVVGIDAVPESDAAIRWACAEAAVRGVVAELVHAWNEPIELSVDLESDALPGIHGPLTVSAMTGDVLSVLLRSHPDLLVLGARADARRLSSIARACISQASCPVVVVSRAAQAPADRVVVGVDGSPASRSSLTWAAREAHLRSAQLVAAYVWQVRPASLRQMMNPARAVPEQQPEALDRLRGWVADVLGPMDVELHAVHGPPLEGLLDLSAGAVLLVLGHSARSRLGRVLSSNLATGLTSLATCPVAVA